MLRKGFTLIEILIVTGIIIVITGFSLAAHRNFDETRKLQELAQQIVGALELTKKDAIAGNYRQALNASCTSRIAQFWWTVGIGPTGTVYTYHVGTRCYNGASYLTFGEHFVYLPKNFSFTNNGYVLFRPFGLGINSNSPITITVKNNATNKTKNIIIDKAGNISIQ